MEVKWHGGRTVNVHHLQFVAGVASPIIKEEEEELVWG
jgi:hypothetical protein